MLSQKLEDADGDDNDDHFIVSAVVEVKPEATPPRKKRTYRPRKPRNTKSSKAVKNGSESMDNLIGQLVSAYCGNDGHPANCQDCKSRIDAIRALLQSSEKCQKDETAITAGEDEPTPTTSSLDGQEPSDSKTASVGLFSCSNCSDRFDTFQELKKHEKTHFAAKKPCSVCNRQISARYMAVHMRTHSGEKPFICADCGASFAAAKTLKEHRFKHSGERPHQCTYCQRSFVRNSTLKIHVRLHTADLPHACQVCDKRFPTIWRLKQHTTNMHSGQKIPRKRYPRKPPSDAEESQTCPDCGKVLSGRTSMKTHRFLHTGTRPFVCNVCGRSFTRYQHLIDHTLRHTGNKPHVCEQCGAQFSRPSSLKVHYRLHTGELPFSCNLCGASFAQSSNLIQHTRSHHTLDKPFICSFCGERFMWSKDRSLHVMRRHTHDKPFPCDICGRQCLTKYELRSHKQSQHSVEPKPVRPRHQCSHCPATFCKKSTLMKHVQKHFGSAGTDEEESPTSAVQSQPNFSPSGYESVHPKHGRYSNSTPGTAQSKDATHRGNVTQKRSQFDTAVDRAKTTASLSPRRHFCPHCQMAFTNLATLSRHVHKHFALSDWEGEERLATEEPIDDQSSSDNGHND